jgi:DNA-directed RNA polymerase alpha subunit
MKETELQIIFSIIESPAIIEKLSPIEMDRKLLLLRLQQGKTFWQISKELNLRYSNTNLEYKRALLRLKRNIKEIFEDFEKVNALQKEILELKAENAWLKKLLPGVREVNGMDIKEKEWLHTSIGAIGLDIKTRDAVVRLGINTVGQLLQYKEQALRKAPGIGEKTLNSLMLFLKQSGLSLAES